MPGRIRTSKNERGVPPSGHLLRFRRLRPAASRSIRYGKRAGDCQGTLLDAAARGPQFRALAPWRNGRRTGLKIRRSERAVLVQVQPGPPVFAARAAETAAAKLALASEDGLSDQRGYALASQLTRRRSVGCHAEAHRAKADRISVAPARQATLRLQTLSALTKILFSQSHLKINRKGGMLSRTCRAPDEPPSLSGSTEFFLPGFFDGRAIRAANRPGALRPNRKIGVRGTPGTSPDCAPNDQKQERPPRARRPFHCQAAGLPLKPCPRLWRESRSRQAAENDNETLDHLLSIWLRGENIAALARNGRWAMKRVWIAAIAMALAISPAGAAGASWLGRELFVPGGHFDAAKAPPAPDYAKELSWGALPQMKDASDVAPAGARMIDPAAAAVDVFFINPTSYFSGRHWNADAADADTNAKTDKGSLRNQASVFNGCCAVYAPRYRQMTFGGFIAPSKDSAAAMDLAYSDVKRAFEYYLAHYNRGRPFIIASHSQGSRHAKVLVTEMIDGTPVMKQFVAAYILGNWLDENWFQSLKTVKVCESAEQTGCVVTWSSLADDADAQAQREDFVSRSGLPADFAQHKYVCINPLTWTTADNARARERRYWRLGLWRRRCPAPARSASGEHALRRRRVVCEQARRLDLPRQTSARRELSRLRLSACLYEHPRECGSKGEGVFEVASAIKHSSSPGLSRRPIPSVWICVHGWPAQGRP